MPVVYSQENLQYMIAKLAGLLFFILIQACAHGAQPKINQELNLAPRSNHQLSGASVSKQLAKLSSKKREERIYREVASGNIPSFLRDLSPVKLFLTNGKTAIIYVTRDYISIGSEDDFIRMPMALPTALRIARKVEMDLPTPEMVDAIYRSAEVKLSPRFLPPGKDMVTLPYFVKHNRIIQRSMSNSQTKLLVSGHKKDIIKPTIADRRRLAIYGWHHSVDRVQQPLSRAHHRYYVDYSHGVRLVSKNALVDNRLVPTSQIIGLISKDPVSNKFDEDPLW